MSASEFAFVGRFQPFHLGHWEIVAGLLERAERLYIGITNPDIRSLGKKTSSPHRHGQAANPFSFHERLGLVSAALATADRHRCQTFIVPFPLDQSSVWHNYIPQSAVQIVRIFSEWEAEKTSLLQAGGYEVETLIGSADQKIAASDVRAAIAEERSFSHWLPPGVSAAVDNIGKSAIQSRILGSDP